MATGVAIVQGVITLGLSCFVNATLQVLVAVWFNNVRQHAVPVSGLAASAVKHLALFVYVKKQCEERCCSRCRKILNGHRTVASVLPATMAMRWRCCRRHTGTCSAFVTMRRPCHRLAAGPSAITTRCRTRGRAPAAILQPVAHQASETDWQIHTPMIGTV